jgi:hypothetical protein
MLADFAWKVDCVTICQIETQLGHIVEAADKVAKLKFTFVCNRILFPSLFCQKYKSRSNKGMCNERFLLDSSLLLE